MYEWGLLISGLTHKEYWSCYSCPHSKIKAEQNENQQLFLDPGGNWSHRANRCPQIRETMVETEPQNRLSVGKFDKSKHHCDPGLVKPSHFCEFHLEGAYQVLTVKAREKSSQASSNPKVAILKYVSTFCFSQQGCPHQKLFLSKFNLPGFYQNLTYLGEGKCPTWLF